MRIDFIVCPDEINEKLARIWFAENGYIEGEDVYVAFRQTFARHYLSVFFVYKPDHKTAIIISARDVSQKERKTYGRK